MTEKPRQKALRLLPVGQYDTSFSQGEKLGEVFACFQASLMGPALSGIRLTAQKYERRIKYIGMMMIEELPIALAIQRYALDWL